MIRVTVPIALFPLHIFTMMEEPLPDEIRGIIHLAPVLEMDDEFHSVCVGIGGYWAEAGGSPRLEDSPVFSSIEDALEWADSRAQTIFIRGNMTGPIYWRGLLSDKAPKGATPLDIEELIRQFDGVFGTRVD